MKTPIYDFVKEYADSGISRFHMPGHKGAGQLGFESLDITEITGADVLSEAEGIIGESEENASRLFGTAHTYYSAEGSTLAIKAMLSIVCAGVERPLILAARNAHKAFLYAAALLDIDVEWIYSESFMHITSCQIDANALESAIEALDRKPCAVYITSPDYLGQSADVAALANLCHSHSLPLLVDNAHGAYLAFDKPNKHPIHLGADMCCDSAHKTLPVLTGGAYLHISKNADAEYLSRARDAMALFASTSPSYLILQSLDLCNAYLESSFSDDIEKCKARVEAAKNHIRSRGFSVLDSEPLKIVIDAAGSGYTGYALSELLRENKTECEFADGEFVVLMASPKNSERDFERLASAFDSIPPKAPLEKEPLSIKPAIRKMTVREAVFSRKEEVSVDAAIGRICAELAISCPPAVPIAVCGELITEGTAALLKRYGVEKIKVVK